MSSWSGGEVPRASFTEAARGLAEHTQRMARLEVRLAVAETRAKLQSLGLATGLALTGALLALAGGAFLLASVAAALALVMPTWAALLVVAGLLLATAAILVGLAVGLFRRGTPPVPEAAIEEARETLHVVTDGRR